jgi:tetratricopeptide (TPR) repeat protein
VSELDTALTLDAEFAEALALRAACLSAPQEIAGGYAPLAGHRARKDLERARQLAARNPRVLLIDAMSDYALSPSQGGNKDRALAKLREAVAAFEAERGDTEHLPGWGAAEAWLLLGRDLLDHGDPVGARDALEHALLIAPEFAQARRLMAKITAG